MALKKVIAGDGFSQSSAGPSASTVLGPTSSTDNAVAIWDGTTGKLLKDSTLAYGAGALTITKTTEQLRIRYDSSNYIACTIASNGRPSFNAIGSDPNLYQFAVGGNVILQFSVQSGTGGTIVATGGATASFSTSTAGNTSATIPRFDVSGNPFGGAAGLSDGGASNALGLVINSSEVVHLTATKLSLTSGVAFQLGNTATTGLIAGALAALTTASIVILDSTGTAYRVPCVTP